MRRVDCQSFSSSRLLGRVGEAEKEAGGSSSRMSQNDVLEDPAMTVRGCAARPSTVVGESRKVLERVADECCIVRIVVKQSRTTLVLYCTLDWPFFTTIVVATAGLLNHTVTKQSWRDVSLVDARVFRPQKTCPPPPNPYVHPNEGTNRLNSEACTMSI